MVKIQVNVEMNIPDYFGTETTLKPIISPLPDKFSGGVSNRLKRRF